jgi:hypothetical protein
MNARSLIKCLGAAAALYWPGCGPGLVPPSADSAKVPAGGFAGTSGTTSTTDNPGNTKTGGAGGSGSLPTAGGAGRAGQGGAPPPPPNDADAGSEDAGAEP